MKRMTIGEKKIPFSIVKNSKYIIHKGKIGPQIGVRRWLKIGNKSNRRKKVTKRSWKLLKELWDEIRINNKKMQTTDVDMAAVSGEESFDREMVQSFSKMEISTPSPPPVIANIKPSDSVKFERCHTPSMGSSNTELEPFPEPQEEISARERNTHFSPFAESLASEREKASSTSQCPYCPATNLDPQLAAYIMDLKNYNEYRNWMEAMTLEKAALERYSAEANLHHNELQVNVQQIVKKNAELQNQILLLKREQVEQKIAHQKEMHLMELKMKNLKMRMATAGNSLYDDSNYPPVMVEQSRQIRNTTDIAETTQRKEYRYV